MQGPVGLHHLAQAAVDPKPHHRVPLVGFDVNVAGAVPCGLGQQGIEHADDGRIVRGFQQVLDGWQVLHHARQVGVAFDLADHRCGARFALGIGGADALHQGWRGLGLNLAHRVFAHHLAHTTAQRRRVQPQRELARLLLEQHLLGAGKSVGQRVAHGRGRQCRLRVQGLLAGVWGLVPARPGNAGSCTASLIGSTSLGAGCASFRPERIKS